ncbi:ATP-binding protein [Nonomuraea soli]|uniref:DNA-binding SARP family transcriptional activator n=1 Tax=Nonomuraea soli TaxID=1032476 RepID=A0A7W0CNW8_9ACTN|nr:AAA family ATPase [Nonomuraea soli]MBA2894509.1 DNA-binding SARP family transcriptional activator [Nonomuraea soli]
MDDRIEVRLVGPLAVRRGDRILPAGAVGSRQARTLLALLAVRHGQVVPADTLADAVWGGAQPPRPARNLATLVSRLRTALGAAVIEGGSGGYRLGASVEVDLTVAAGRIAEAEERLTGRELALALAAARAASGLLDGPGVLADRPDVWWAEPARAAHEALLRRARHLAAEAALRAGNSAAAVSAAGEAMRADPLDESACRLLMRAHDGAGEAGRALAVYERLRSTLAQELGADPSPATRDLHAAILAERSPSAHDTRRAHEAEFVGREAELERLAGAWQQAMRGEARLVLLTGEAGIGKTSLALRFARTVAASGAHCVSARCFEAERSLFLQPFAELLTQLAAGLSPAELREAASGRAAPLALLVPDLAAVLDAGDGERGSAEIERRRAYEAITLFLRRLCARQPLLLVIDDLQHASRATVELLHYLAAHFGSGRLLALATARAEEGQAVRDLLGEAAEPIEVGPLDAGSVERLATAAGHAGLAGQIGERTRGHTLFVVESLRALAAGESGVPESLRTSVLARVRRAGAPAEELLRAASVLGPSFAPATVAGLLDIGVQEAARRCERALEARLSVITGREYEFANDLIQEILYSSIPVPTRTAYHRAAADLLAGNPEAVARHSAAAGDWQRAASGWLAAGQRAIARYAVDDAHSLLDLALGAATRAADPELRGQAHLHRGRANEMAFRFEAALADHEAAVELGRATGDRRLEMSALRQLGGAAWAGCGRPVAEGLEHVRDGLRQATLLGDRGAEAHLLGWLAVVSSNQLRLGDALGHGHRALAAARQAHDDHALAAALDGLKTAHAHLGRMPELSRLIGELEPLLRELGDLWLLQWCVFESALPMVAVGAWDDAAARIHDALAVNRRSGYTGYDRWYLAHLGWIARLRGDYDEAVRYGRQSLDGDSHAWWTAATPAMHATTLIELGHDAEATALLERAMEACSAHGTLAYTLRCLAPLAEVTGSATLLKEADTLVSGIETPPGAAWLQGTDAYVSVARAHLARGDARGALRVLEPVLTAAPGAGWTAPVAAARELAGRCRAALSPARGG